MGIVENGLFVGPRLPRIRPRAIYRSFPAIRALQSPSLKVARALLLKDSEFQSYEAQN